MRRRHDYAFLVSKIRLKYSQQILTYFWNAWKTLFLWFFDVLTSRIKHSKNNKNTDKFLPCSYINRQLMLKHDTNV